MFMIVGTWGRHFRVRVYIYTRAQEKTFSFSFVLPTNRSVVFVFDPAGLMRLQQYVLDTTIDGREVG